MLEILIVLFFLLLDQGTKLLCAAKMTLGDRIPVIEGFFSILYDHNTGMAFGALNRWPYARWLFLAVTLVVLGVMLYFYRKERKDMHTLMKISLSLIFAGAVGNFIDRLFLGYVRDMIFFHFFPYIFNVADAAVCVGMGLLVLDILFGKGKRYLQEPSETEKE